MASLIPTSILKANSSLESSAKPEPQTEVAAKDSIIREMIRAIKHLGAKSDLLGVVCSYGETYSDEQVLVELREWNQFGRMP